MRRDALDRLERLTRPKSIVLTTDDGETHLAPADAGVRLWREDPSVEWLRPLLERGLRERDPQDGSMVRLVAALQPVLRKHNKLRSNNAK